MHIIRTIISFHLSFVLAAFGTKLQLLHLTQHCRSLTRGLVGAFLF